MAPIKSLTMAGIEVIAREDLLPSIRELVRGIYYERTDPKGVTRIYQQTPNHQMVIAVLDRILGRVPTPITGGIDDDGNERPILIIERAAPES